jgi:hypothetical protein
LSFGQTGPPGLTSLHYSVLIGCDPGHDLL